MSNHETESTLPPPPAKPSKWKTWHKVTLSVILTFTVILILGGIFGSDPDEAAPSETTEAPVESAAPTSTEAPPETTEAPTPTTALSQDAVWSAYVAGPHWEYLTSVYETTFELQGILSGDDLEGTPDDAFESLCAEAGEAMQSWLDEDYDTSLDEWPAFRQGLRDQYEAVIDGFVLALDRCANGTATEMTVAIDGWLAALDTFNDSLDAL